MSRDTSSAPGRRFLGKAHVSANLEGLGEVRHLVEDLARKAMLDEDRTYDLKVAVSEACANAIEHAISRGEVVLCSWLDEERLLVQVRHPGDFQARAHGLGGGHRGLGLPLMVALMDEVIISRPAQGGTWVSLSMYLR